MIEELAVGAQFGLPYVHIVVNNAYLGLIRQSQRGFNMDYSVQLAFENINAPELGVYGVDHVKVAEGLGCKAIRVTDPEAIGDALERARDLAQELMSRSSSRSSSSASPTSRWAPRSTPSRSSRISRKTGATRRPRSRCSTELQAKETRPCRGSPPTSPCCSTRSLPRSLRGRRQSRLPRRRVSSSPTPIRRRLWPSGLQRHGLTQVLHNLPAGDWATGERGIACLPDRVGEFRDGVGQAHRLRQGARLRAAQLPGRHARPKERRPDKARGRPDREPALRRARARKGRGASSWSSRSTPSTFPAFF